VQRLGLLKQLVDRGHPIGQLAHLSTDELRTLGGGGAPRDGVLVRPIDVERGCASPPGSVPVDRPGLHDPRGGAGAAGARGRDPAAAGLIKKNPLLAGAGEVQN